jgi:enolase
MSINLFRRIESIEAMEVLDSRGYPTVEVTVFLDSGIGTAAVPSGASTGSFEAVELRDGGARLFGKGVLNAVSNVNDIIAPKLIGLNGLDQEKIDQTLIELDGTEDKSRLGANAILPVSLAVCRAAADATGMPLYRYISGINKNRLPRPMMNILNGGVHADNKLDIQEFMIVPAKEGKFSEYVVACSAVYHTLKEMIKSRGLNSNVGDEGGVAPNISSTTEALDLIIEAIEKAGYKPGQDIQIALDVAASELLVDGAYSLEGTKKSSEDMIEFYAKLIKDYPIISIEDPLSEEDWDGWAALQKAIGDEVQIVGDDIFVTNKTRLQKGIDMKTANAILIKPNQVGTITETLETIETAQRNGYNVVISHRSGETCDTVISDLAVAVSAQFLKAGAPARGERVEKYNKLLRIEQTLIHGFAKETYF